MSWSLEVTFRLKSNPVLNPENGDWDIKIL